MAEKLVIIGSGPASWTAAIYAARANLEPLVFAGRPKQVPSLGPARRAAHAHHRGRELSRVHPRHHRTEVDGQPRTAGRSIRHADCDRRWPEARRVQPRRRPRLQIPRLREDRPLGPPPSRFSARMASRSKPTPSSSPPAPPPTGSACPMSSDSPASAAGSAPAPSVTGPCPSSATRNSRSSAAETRPLRRPPTSPSSPPRSTSSTAAISFGPARSWPNGRWVIRKSRCCGTRWSSTCSATR